jgi:hypothetical protein
MPLTAGQLYQQIGETTAEDYHLVVYLPDGEMHTVEEVTTEPQAPRSHPTVWLLTLPIGWDQPPATSIEAIIYWAKRIKGGSAETAGGSMDLDYAHDKLTKAAKQYLGIPDVTDDQLRGLQRTQAERAVLGLTKQSAWGGENG